MGSLTAYPVLLLLRVLAFGEAPRHGSQSGKCNLRCEKAEAGIPWPPGLRLLLENGTEKSEMQCQVHRPTVTLGPGAPKLLGIQVLLSQEELGAESGPTG